MYPRVYDINKNLVAILDKAFKIGYTKIKNNLWTCQFTLPLNDKKNKHVKPKYFIDIYDHDRRIGKFIVNPKKTIKNESANEITYNCEHVLSTLHSDVLFGYFQYSNYTTRQVLEYLMDQQEVKHWEIGTVSFTRYFHYSFENEDSLANAIFSVPKPFDVPYLWSWDDSTYPFTLNLVEPPTTIKDIIASGKNLRGIEVDEDPTNIVTRIYPLGAGEGVNQLNIKSVNSGIPYLQNNDAVADYGVHKRIWVDRRFTDAESLKASAQGILDKFSKPIKSIAIDCRDYTLYERKRKRELMAEYDVGDMLLVHDQDTNTHEEIRLEKIEKSDIYGAPQDIKLELGSLIEDYSTTITDLQKKQFDNDTNSQGATNILNFGYQDNADSRIPALISFYVDDDVVNINTCELTFRTKKYRAYSETTQSAGQVIQSSTTGGGGATVKASTTGSGGSVVQGVTTQGGGGSSKTSAAGGDHRHKMFTAVGFDSNLSPNTSVMLRAANGHMIHVNDGTSASLEFYTEGTSGNHTHTYETPVHTHNLTINIPNHNHSFEFQLENHTHPFSFTIAGHRHEIEHKITELNEMPSSVVIKVDGNLVPYTSIEGDRINLVDYMEKDSSGKITRGRHELEILPNERARIEADLILRVFIQSRIGGTY